MIGLVALCIVWATICIAGSAYWCRKDIRILYLRTDKKTKEFEAERQVRVKLSRRVSKLEHELRQLKPKVKNHQEFIKDAIINAQPRA